MTKKDWEKVLIERIQNIGIEKYFSTYGEGRKRNNEYYQIELNDGSVHYIASPSQEFKDVAGIE